MVNRLVTILALTGLAFAAADSENRSACEAVDAAISEASEVYYPGEYECKQLSRW